MLRDISGRHEEHTKSKPIKNHEAVLAATQAKSALHCHLLVKPVKLERRV